MDFVLFILACAVPGFVLGGTRLWVLGLLLGGLIGSVIAWYAAQHNSSLYGVVGQWAGYLLAWWTTLIATGLGRTIGSAIKVARQPPSEAQDDSN